jgi:hypothetical protein
MPIFNPPVSSLDITFLRTKANNCNSLTKQVLRQWSEIVSANRDRQSLTILNRGFFAVFIDVFSTEPQNYMIKLEPGAFYEMPSQGIYTESLYASADTDKSDEFTILEIREFFQTTSAQSVD